MPGMKPGMTSLELIRASRLLANGLP
jgi:hypothetical protein